jgi:hypothetical protein
MSSTSSFAEELVNPYSVTFELDDGNEHEEQYSTVPQYDTLSKTVKQLCPEVGFTISLNGTVLTKSNTTELLTAAASCDGDFVLPDLQLRLQVRTEHPKQRPDPPTGEKLDCPPLVRARNGTIAQILCLVGALLVSGRYTLFPAASSPSHAETMFSVSLETIDHLREQLALQAAEIALLRSRSTPIPVPRVVAKPCPSVALQAEVAEKNATIIELRALLEKYGFTLERQYDEMYALRRRLRTAETCCSSVKLQDERCPGSSQTNLLALSSTTTGTMSPIEPYIWHEPSRSVEHAKTTRTPAIAPPVGVDGSTRALKRPLVHEHIEQTSALADRSVIAMADLTSRLQRLDNPLDSALRSSLLRIVQDKPEAPQKKCGPHLEGAAIHYAFVAEHGTWPKELKPKWNTTVPKCEAACRELPDCGGWSFRYGQPEHLHFKKCFLYSSAVTSWFELRPIEQRQDPEKYFVSGLCSKRELRAASGDLRAAEKMVGSNNSDNDDAEAESAATTISRKDDTEKRFVDDAAKRIVFQPAGPVNGKSTAITALLGTLNQHRGITIFDSEFQIKAPTSAGVLNVKKAEEDVAADATIDEEESSPSSSTASAESNSPLAVRASTDVIASPAAYQKRWKSASMWKFEDEGELPGRSPPKKSGFDRRGQYMDGSSVPARTVPTRYLA